ncbi:MAG: type II secretion system minor pseudopilin GspI [Gammaproteobacteria bacterium]
MNSEAQRGFTLIEVVVALAVVIIAFMAMYGSMMQSVATTTLMQEKTIATWIAFDRITELRINNEFPDDDERTDELEMAGQEWVYTIEFVPTQSDNILQVIVKVSPALEPDNILGLASGALVRPQAGTEAGAQPPEGILR